MKYRNFKRRLQKLAVIEREPTGPRTKETDNHTRPWQIVELKTQPRPCEFECGQQLVTNQHITYFYIDNGVWMKKCNTCGLWQDPATGEMREHQAFKNIFIRNRMPFTHRD